MVRLDSGWRANLKAIPSDLGLRSRSFVGLGCGIDSPRERRNRRHQLTRIHRSREVHLKTAAQRSGSIFRTREGGKRRCRNPSNRLVRRTTETRDQLEAVHPGHAKIDNQHIWRRFRDALERVERGVQGRHLSTGGRSSVMRTVGCRISSRNRSHTAAQHRPFATTSRRHGSGSNRFRTGKASSLRLRRWCGSRCICGSGGRRSQNRCTLRMTRRAVDMVVARQPPDSVRDDWPRGSLFNLYG